MEQANLNKEWIKRLGTDREEIVIESIRELRRSGNNDLLPAITDLLQSSRNPQIQSEVISFLNDLKNQSSVDIFIEILKAHRGRYYFAKLVGACWQNGLDYSGHIDFFIDVVLKDEYATSIEAFTVIESNITRIAAGKRETLAAEIGKSLENVAREKGPLVEELAGIMKPYNGPFSVDRD